MIQTVTSPTPQRSVTLLATGFEQDGVVTIDGTCTLTTKAQTVPEKRRHILVKPDGVVLVHDSRGREPTASRPPGETPTVTQTDETVILSTEQSDEEFRVSFSSIHHITVSGLEEHTGQTVTEDDLKTAVLETPAIVEEGFQPLATERQTRAGPVDIYGEDAAGRTVVIELKRTRVGPAAVSQLNRYVTALKEELHTDAVVRGILVAPSVTDRAHRLLAEEGLEFVSVSLTQVSP